MNLIEEIEAAATSRKPTPNNLQALLSARHVVDSPWWLRIKAALEAAQEMDERIRSLQLQFTPGASPYASQVIFRLAMN
jgi:hypothetical protein